jgi:hypothetical protein
MGYILFMFIHCARTRASARVGKRSHIFGRIPSKFGKKHAHHKVTTSYIGYILLMSMLRARVHLLIFGRILSKFGGVIQQIPEVTWAI